MRRRQTRKAAFQILHADVHADAAGADIESDAGHEIAENISQRRNSKADQHGHDDRRKRQGGERGGYQAEAARSAKGMGRAERKRMGKHGHDDGKRAGEQEALPPQIHHAIEENMRCVSHHLLKKNGTMFP